MTEEQKKEVAQVVEKISDHFNSLDHPLIITIPALLYFLISITRCAGMSKEMLIEWVTNSLQSEEK